MIVKITWLRASWFDGPRVPDIDDPLFSHEFIISGALAYYACNGANVMGDRRRRLCTGSIMVCEGRAQGGLRRRIGVFINDSCHLNCGSTLHSL